jgi:hypothetical protein
VTVARTVVPSTVWTLEPAGLGLSEPGARATEGCASNFWAETRWTGSTINKHAWPRTKRIRSGGVEGVIALEPKPEPLLKLPLLVLEAGKEAGAS